MNEIIRTQLARYKPANALEEENAIKEIIQEIALYALWRANFFDVAVFQGGTSLRILHKLPRFSEDLDFMLLKPDRGFDWQPYLKSLTTTFEEYGLKPETSSREQMESRIRKAVIKEDSIANQLNLGFATGGRRRLLKIKLEIDVVPPAHSRDSFTYLNFPVDYEVRHQDMASNFALKIHALLCRGFLKGRDWFDFSWYVSQGVYPNLPHLEAALRQFGQWQDDKYLTINSEWLQSTLTGKIISVDWNAAKDDVRRFLKPAEEASLGIWSDRFFLSKLGEMLSSAQQ
jgi:predicted nucleotidyltransferase component of viral defense system